MRRERGGAAAWTATRRPPARGGTETRGRTLGGGGRGGGGKGQWRERKWAGTGGQAAQGSALGQEACAVCRVAGAGGVSHTGPFPGPCLGPSHCPPPRYSHSLPAGPKSCLNTTGEGGAACTSRLAPWPPPHSSGGRWASMPRLPASSFPYAIPAGRRPAAAVARRKASRLLESHSPE